MTFFSTDIDDTVIDALDTGTDMDIQVSSSVDVPSTAQLAFSWDGSDGLKNWQGKGWAELFEQWWEWGSW